MAEAPQGRLAAVSHELRTPLTAVLGFAEVLAHDAEVPDEERGELIGAIAKEAIDLSNIVEDLLVVARAEVGNLQMAQVSVDLCAQLRQILEAHEDIAARIVEIPVRPVHALGDPGRIRQILRNLLTNAHRYGGEHIRIRISPQEETATVRVIDNGSGVPAEDRDRIFDPYERAHDTPGLTASVGLGLTVSRRLARLMGGDLSYHYTPNVSTFELTLPLTDPHDAHHQLPAAVPSEAGSEKAAIHSA